MKKNIRRKYKKPAVQEVIFEVKFNPENYGNAFPGQVFEKIKSYYPKKKDIVTVAFGPQSPESLLHLPVLQAWKEDDSELIQIGQPLR